MRADDHREPMPYSDAVETLVLDEDLVIAETVERMRRAMIATMTQRAPDSSSPGVASQAVLVGTLTVADDLPEELAQGVFGRPTSYDAVLLLTNRPEEIDGDRSRRAQGAVLKVLSVPGRKLADWFPGHDWWLSTDSELPEGDAVTHLSATRQREGPGKIQRRSGSSTLALVPPPPAPTPRTHPLAFSYYTPSAFRYGDYVAKLRLRPAGLIQGLREAPNDRDDTEQALVRDSMATHVARFDLQVQLRTDAATMPVENSSVQWPEALSPFRTVGTLDLPVQNSFSPARRVYADTVLGVHPWSGLVSHRPLGSINRVRRRAYQELDAWRREMHGANAEEPLCRADVPL